METTEKYTDLQKFSALVEKLLKHGFRVVERAEMSKYQKAANLIPPDGRKPRKGQTALLYTHINGMKVLCWTTFNMRYSKFSDAGVAAAWVLILDKDGEARHISRMIKRVGAFVDRILKECVINKTRVASSDYCPSCGAPMKLNWRREYLRGRYWICSRAGVHKKKGENLPIFSFNNGIEGKLLVYLNKRNKSRTKYAKKRRKEGKDPQHQMKTRKKWQKTSSA